MPAIPSCTVLAVTVALGLFAAAMPVQFTLSGGTPLTMGVAFAHAKGGDDGDSGGSDGGGGDRSGRGGGDDSDGGRGRGRGRGGSDDSGGHDDSGGGDSGGGGGSNSSGSGSSGGGSDDHGASGNGNGGSKARGSSGNRGRASIGGNVELRYSNGWRERIRNGRYRLTDPKGRTVRDRPATQEDAVRMRDAQIQ